MAGEEGASYFCLVAGVPLILVPFLHITSSLCCHRRQTRLLTGGDYLSRALALLILAHANIMLRHSHPVFCGTDKAEMALKRFVQVIRSAPMMTEIPVNVCCVDKLKMG